ncbi:hypothetical protein BH09BAC6_BH09BAC6_03660 [soil metagenome]|jgi:hypothetical protein
MPYNRIGFWSAILSLIFAIGYSIPQLLSTFGAIPHPQDLFWLFLPSLFLAPAFLVTMICLHYRAPEGLKIWTAIGWSFAALYAIAVSSVYFTQLTVVLPAQTAGKIDENHILIFGPKTFLMAIDCLGYFFMSLSTFFAAYAFPRVHKWLYRGLLWNGLLIPVLILAFFFPWFYYIGALWMITFPLAMINAARLFHNVSLPV